MSLEFIDSSRTITHSHSVGGEEVHVKVKEHLGIHSASAVRPEIATDHANFKSVGNYLEYSNNY